MVPPGALLDASCDGLGREADLLMFFLTDLTDDDLESESCMFATAGMAKPFPVSFDEYESNELSPEVPMLQNPPMQSSFDQLEIRCS